jgi:hypothetical protein
MSQVTVSVSVSDPCHHIASIAVLHESSEAVVLVIDLNGSAKRETPVFQGRSFFFGRHEPFTEVTVHGDNLGDEPPITAAETARHTCVVTLARRREARDTWRAP